MAPPNADHDKLSSSMSPAPIRSVGRYELLEVIGRGGAAVVYLAYQGDLSRRVALKELAPFQAVADPNFAGRFAEESRVAGSLSHPNIVTVHEYFEHEGVPYIAMEYLSQGSLRAYVGTLTLAQIAGLLEGVLAGLAHGQSRAIVHRDLKPENLLVTADGRVKIADFGVARAYADAAPRPVVTAVGTTIGTPAYMAPEQALGKDVGPAADLYSLGIVAWELLIGRVPFEEKDTPVAVLYQHVHEPIPPVRTVAPDVDPRIEAWLQRMLAKDPADRFPSAEAAWEELEDVVLELLGPRWRRDARLPVIETAVAGRPLTPAVFKGNDAGAAEVADAPAPSRAPRLGKALAGAPSSPPAQVTPPERSAAEPTLDGVPTPDPIPAVAPPIPAPEGRPTLHRLARRHDLEEEAPAESSKRSRLGLAIAAVVAAVVVAAVVGALVGSSGGTRTVVRKPPATPSPATQAADVVAVLKGIAAARQQGIKRLDAAKHASAQASAATDVEHAYAAGAGKLAALPAATSDRASVRSIEATLTGLAKAYGSLSTDARGLRKVRYADERKKIATAERTLSSETKALS
jgi:Protein kinase domain